MWGWRMWDVGLQIADCGLRIAECGLDKITINSITNN
jgi:hypothetical protein